MEPDFGFKKLFNDETDKNNKALPKQLTKYL